MKSLIKLFSAALLLAGMSLSASPYSLDGSHTNVGFSVKHLMITNVKGSFKNFTGEIDFDAKTKSFNVFKGVIKATSVDTDNEKRDNHLKSDDFFAAAKHPNITFVMKTYKADGDEGVMTGDLTIRGITKEVKLDVEELGIIKDFKGNNRVGFTLKGKINRMDFDLKWNKALEFGGVAVGEKVKLTVDIEAVEK